MRYQILLEIETHSDLEYPDCWIANLIEDIHQAYERSYNSARAVAKLPRGRPLIANVNFPSTLKATTKREQEVMNHEDFR